MAIFYNQATLIHNGHATNSNTTSGTVLDALSFTKAPVYGSYGKGGTVSYLITVTNNGSTAASDITVSDNLGEYAFGGGTVFPLEYIDASLLYFISGIPATAPTATVTDGRLTVSGISIPAGATAQLIYTARANEYAPLEAGSVITNTAALDSPVARGLLATASVSVNEEALLSVTKFVSPDSVSANEELTYTFVIQNTGNAAAPATDDTVITDVFDPVLDITSVSFNGAPLAEGTGYTYDAGSGAFSTLPGAISVPAAVYSKDATGATVTTPGVSVLTVTGTV